MRLESSNAFIKYVARSGKDMGSIGNGVVDVAGMLYHLDRGLSEFSRRNAGVGDNE